MGPKETMMNKSLEEHKNFHEMKIKLEEIRHKNIMEELEFMKKNKISSFVRSG